MAFRRSLRPLSSGGGSDQFGLGCAPIGNLYTPVADAAAEATVARALERGIRFFDTAPHYGEGISERRLGAALRGTDRDSVVLATKVGRVIVGRDGQPVPAGGTGVHTVADLSRDGVWRSVEGSLARLGTDRIDLLYLHDPADAEQALAGAIPALVELRAQQVVRAIGVGLSWCELLLPFVQRAPVDVVMLAGRLTLLDHSGEAEVLPAARERGIGVIAAGVFNSGILADPERAGYFDYQVADPRLVQRARRLQEACAGHGISLATAAAAHPLRLPGVEAVVVGARTPAEVDSWLDGADQAIDAALWDQLDELRDGQPPGSELDR